MLQTLEEYKERMEREQKEAADDDQQYEDDDSDGGCGDCSGLAYCFFFMVVSPTIDVALDRFTIGIGFNFYDYNNLILYGLTVKTAVWF